MVSYIYLVIGLWNKVVTSLIEEYEMYEQCKINTAVNIFELYFTVIMSRGRYFINRRGSCEIGICQVKTPSAAGWVQNI